MLQFWHPYFLEQYTGMLNAFSQHLSTAPYHARIAGVRMNWNAAGTEMCYVPPNHRDTGQWVSPPHGLTPAPPFNDTTQLSVERHIFHAHVNAFITAPLPEKRTFLLVRNSLPDTLRNETIALPNGSTGPASDLFASGTAGWFHTSSEIEPRAGDLDQYTTFLQYCKDTPTTACYAEPWASAWGDHGGKLDARVSILGPSVRLCVPCGCVCGYGCGCECVAREWWLVCLVSDVYHLTLRGLSTYP